MRLAPSLRPPLRLREAARFAVAVMLCGSAVGCRAWVDSYQLGPSDVRPDPSRPAFVTREMAPASTRVTVTPAGDGLDVVAATPTMCRDTLTTPTVADTTTKHELGVGGWMAQLALAAGAVGLTAGGAYLLSDPCAPMNAQDAPCLDQARQAVQTTAGAALATGGGMALLFFANALGSVDETEVVAAEPRHRRGPWQACSWTPVAHARVQLRLPDGASVWTRTDHRGRAHLTLRRAGQPIYDRARASTAEATLLIAGFPFGKVLLERRQPTLLSALDGRAARAPLTR